jgi:hypothetical protein
MQEFALVPSADGAFFPNDGHIGGDFLIATGGLELRLTANINQPVHYYFGLGGGVSRVRERIHRLEETGQMVDGYIEWGPYFAPNVGFDFPISRHVRLFGQAQLFNIFGDRISNYQFLRALIGVRL